MVSKLPNSAIQSKPGAWIVTNNQKDKSKPSDRGRKSIKNGKVYLQDGQEFEIELYNPLQECVLCDIKLNGQSISKNGLVLRPGERFYLDCFIDDRKKFVFKTYEVENSEESESAIEKNGLLEVFFYKEKTLMIKDWKKKFDKIIIDRYPVPVFYPYFPSYPSSPYYPYYPYYPTTICSSITYDNTTKTTIESICTTSNLNSPNTAEFCSNNVTYHTLGVDDVIETGRVERGETTSQQFTEIDMEFENNYISSTVIQILPESRKPVETREIRRQNTKEQKTESDGVIDLIKKLADLHSAGILTDEEFNTKKSQLLSKI